MHHASARTAITRILAGSGFGRHAVACMHAVRLHDDPSCPDAVRDRIMALVLAQPVDLPAPYANPLNQAPVPATGQDLCRQLIPAVIAQAGDPALAIAALETLALLWPHVGADERPLLRTGLLNSLGTARAPAGSVVSTFQLREWQKKVPTHYGVQTPSVGSLRSLFDAPDELAAYLVLAEHLGMTVELETLCWVMGSLSVQLMQAHHDRPGRLALTLAGTAACERLVPLLPAETLVTVVSQLAHRLWWLHAHGGLHKVRTSIDQTCRPYRPAVLTGDITLAQRAARSAAQDPGRFWNETWQLVAELAPGRPSELPRLLATLDSARWRADDGAVVGDDAAALAAVLADLAYIQSPDLAAR